MAYTLSQSVKQTIATYAAVYGVPNNIAQALAIQEGGLNPDGSPRTSPAGAVGALQLEPATANQLGVDPTDTTQNIEGGLRFLGGLIKQYGDVNLALAAYNAGPGVVNDYKNGTNKTGKNPNKQVTGGIPPFSETQNYVKQINDRAGVVQTEQQSNNSASQTSPQINTADPLAILEPTEFVPVAGADIGDDDFEKLTPDMIIQDGLDNLAWFDDPELINAHTQLDSVPVPITFQIRTPGGDGTQVLSSTYDSQGNPTGNPIIVQLNVSAKEMTVAEKHIFHRTPTRTGMHITFWGMQPDIITASGSTGAFYNQFGIASFMSTASFDGTIRDQILALLNQSQPVPAVTTVIENDGEVIPSLIDSTGAATPADLQQMQQGLTTSALRVAAQDAFVELLSLFKNNGVIWFHPSAYSGFMTGNDQQSPTAWSPATGATTFQMNARNNEVMARGHVEMRYKNNLYLGYFKSFSWTMDANTPFQWTFDFVFQVERTISLVYFPQSGGQGA